MMFEQWRKSSSLEASSLFFSHRTVGPPGSLVLFAQSTTVPLHHSTSTTILIFLRRPLKLVAHALPHQRHQGGSANPPLSCCHLVPRRVAKMSARFSCSGQNSHPASVPTIDPMRAISIMTDSRAGQSEAETCENPFRCDWSLRSFPRVM